MKKIIILIIMVFVIFLLVFDFDLFKLRKYHNDDFGIEDYISDNDEDGDGTDDQTDILNNAKRYVRQKPKYKSEYYEGGYPDDGYGVCTDVVAFAFLDAGYDLMTEVNEDIMRRPEMYDIEEPDINIDFRRVKNLDVYFSEYALSLTTDIHDIEEWQGGDVVVFKGHIGIVSDRRTKDGMAYVIHHGYESQIFYEEDILESKEDEIIGHYRMVK